MSIVNFVVWNMRDARPPTTRVENPLCSQTLFNDRYREEEIESTFARQFTFRDLLDEMWRLICVISILSCVATKTISNPIDTLKLADYGTENPEYDVIIDQRQNGSQNFRIKVDGLFIALPEDYMSEPSSEPPPSQFDSLFSSSSGSHQSSSSSSNFGDLTDLASLFDWKKKSKNNMIKPIQDTEGRTKDIPTDVQALDNAKVKLREAAAKEKRKYKLLLVGVNEKYIRPLLRYFKEKSDELEIGPE